MNKRLLVGVFSALMAMAPLCGNAATQSIDAPHLNLTDGCENCHFAGLAPSDCTVRCHQSDVGPYADTVSPIAVTHKDLKCEACHNPHVSLQPTGIAGSFAAVTYDATSGTSTLTGVTPAPAASWAAKTKAERGMILWVADGTTDNASFEIKGVGTDTVTVKGDMSAITARSFDLRRGQLIAKKVTKTAGNSYIQGDLPVQFPSVGSLQVYVDTVNATPTGVCQVCHTYVNAQSHWTSDGQGTDHNPGSVCTECHTHDTGFMPTACNGCHTSPTDPGTGLPVNPDGVPVVEAGLAKPSTNSATAGQHQVHAIDNAITCATCHTGTGMDRISDPKHPIADGKIQIGFSTAKYPQGYLTTYDGQPTVVYEGKNHTTVTNNGAMTCSSVYCHSSGKAIRLGCATPTANTSLRWDGGSVDPQGDTVECNNCHGFEKGNANPMMSGVHYFHVDDGSGQRRGYACYVCHADTTQPVAPDTDATLYGKSELSAAGRINHANGVYNLKGSGAYGPTPITYNTTTASPPPAGGWNPTTRQCTTACHITRTWQQKGTTAALGADIETCPPAGQLCIGDALVNLDPVVAWEVDNIDNNALRVVDISFDADRVDPVKALCQGGGFGGTQGLAKFSHPDSRMGNYMASVNFQGAAVPSTPVVRTYRPSAIDVVTDPNVPRLWFNYRAIDNGPLSYNNSFAAGNIDGDGYNDSGWNAHVINTMNATALSQVNVQPILDFTVTAQRTSPTTCNFIITDLTTDADWNDSNKTTLFGGGHNGSAGVGRLMFNVGAAGTGKTQSIVFTDVPSNVQVIGTANGAPGTVVWYQYFVYDNHYVSIATDRNTKAYQIYSGWKSYILP